MTDDTALARTRSDHRRTSGATRPQLDRSIGPRPVPPTEATTTPARTSSPISVTHHEVVTGDLADRLWESYAVNFDPLAELAVLQHLYDESEIRAEFENRRIDKIIAWQDGQPVGLAMLTNSLEDVPQISPRFLRRRYPEHGARNAIYFVILAMVAQPLRGRTVFSRLHTEMCQAAAHDAGVLVFDVCEFTREMFDPETSAGRAVGQFPNGSLSVLDRQTWYVADLPQPLET